MTDTNESTCVLESPEVVATEERQWTRFKPETTASFLYVDEERFPAEIVDESFEGVGVLINQPIRVDASDVVELEYYGLAIRGQIRSVSTQGNQTRLGIQWSERRRHATDSRRRRCRTESDYAIVAGLPIACRVVDQTADTLIAVLPDHTEIEIKSDVIRTISRFQRLADLKGAEEQLRLLAAVYQLGNLPTPDDALREVLNLEFAPSWD